MPVHSGTIELQGRIFNIDDIVIQATSEVDGDQLRKLSALFMHPEAVALLRDFVRVQGNFDDPSFTKRDKLLQLVKAYIRGRPVTSLAAEEMVGEGMRSRKKYSTSQKQHRVSGQIAYKINIKNKQVGL